MYQYAILILFTLAISDLIVGVSNDAANFLNSSLGSRVAPRRFILLVASLGILAGVTFSSGMMEVARKGIFHPKYFTMPELMVIFLAVMLTDIILLDLYNTYSLPTSTTVSIVFELLGAAVAVSLLKLHQAGSGYEAVFDYINTSKALTIVMGILLSVIVAFGVGAVVQYLSRILLTFDYEHRLRKYGAIWAGVALASITYFILIKGAKGSSFLTAEALAWIQSNTIPILLVTCVVSAVFLQILLSFTRVHILKVVVLVGTFALAMAFAANDLVNFIGVPLAGFSAYTVASGSPDMVTQTMEALSQPSRANTLFLLLAGGVMVTTLWFSRKARSVSGTELSLGRQDEGHERFESTLLSRSIVRVVAGVLHTSSRLVPAGLRDAVDRRFQRTGPVAIAETDDNAPSFDLVRAAVNLMVASALIAWATSMKLPLSTTYVTFMVSMGTSLADQAWGRDSAVFRVTGVLTVVGGWFFTAMSAFSVAAIFATAIFFGGAPVVLGLLGLVIFLIVRTHLIHRTRRKEEDHLEVFNLRKITDASSAVDVTFEHSGIFLREVGNALELGLDGLVQEDRQKLRAAATGQRRIQQWSNIIVANIFKVMRLLHQQEVESTQRYAHTISALQEITESARDIVMRGKVHVANNHAGLLDDQVAELREVQIRVIAVIQKAATILLEKKRLDLWEMGKSLEELKKLTHEYDRNQVARIQDDTSKTRLSILFYAFMWDSRKIAEQTDRLLQIFQDSLPPSVQSPPGQPPSDPQSHL